MVAKQPTGRLESLDILRGLDMFLLVFLQPVLLALGGLIDSPVFRAVLGQLDHAVWDGFLLWDLVMPLFLFMSGVAIPFAMSRYADGRSPKGDALIKIARRFVLLFLLGMVVQGNLLALDPHRIYIFTNTLQAIAVGYAVAALAQLYMSFRSRTLLCVALLVIYWIPMAIVGDYTPQGNFAETIDRAVLGRFRDGVSYDESGVWHFADWYNYTWIWSSLTFGATVLTGSLAGQIIRRYGARRLKAAAVLAIAGAALTVAGLVWGLWHPIIKRLWTSSMVLYSSGLCTLLLALAYYFVDCKGHGRGLRWLKIYGCNAIAAYIMGECINFRSVVNSLTYGLGHLMSPQAYEALLTLGNFSVVFLILLALYRLKIYIRI